MHARTLSDGSGRLGVAEKGESCGGDVPRTLCDRDIVLLASAPWVTQGPLNCHHIASRLASSNRVLYVESTGLRSPSAFHRGDLGKIARRLHGWAGGLVSGPRPITPGLHVLSPMAFPFQSRPGWARLNGMLLARACAAGARRLGFGRPLLWAFLPTAVRVLGSLGESAVIYHCVDDYAGNPGVNAAQVELDERRLARAADLCFATSRPLAARLSGLGARVACVPNVAEVERFLATPERIAGELLDLPGPVVGYVGNIASYKLDVGLLAELARRRPDWSVVLVGQVGGGDPSTRLAELRRLRNVRVLGPRPYETIPSYVHGFDACLIPFRRSRVTNGSLPLKTFEYLAAGKPVVAAPLASLRAEPLDEVVAYASSADEFVRAIEECLARDDGHRRSARRDVASRYSWRTRFAEIQARVAGVLAERERKEAR